MKANGIKALLLVAGTACCALTFNAIAQDSKDRPTFYMGDAPPKWDPRDQRVGVPTWANYRPFVPILTLNKNSTYNLCAVSGDPDDPAIAAGLFNCLYLHYKSFMPVTDHVFFDSHVALQHLHFGDLDSTTTSFWRRRLENGYEGTDTDWSTQANLIIPQNAWIFGSNVITRREEQHPWFSFGPEQPLIGPERARAWTGNFVTSYNTIAGLPDPAMMIFDFEQPSFLIPENPTSLPPGTNIKSHASVILREIFNDPRSSSQSHKIPKYGSGGKTLWEYYNEATGVNADVVPHQGNSNAITWGRWAADPRVAPCDYSASNPTGACTTTNGGINPSVTVSDGDNRRYINFYDRIYRIALSDAFNYSAVVPMTTSWPGIKIGNYGSSTLLTGSETTPTDGMPLRVGSKKLVGSNANAMNYLYPHPTLVPVPAPYVAEELDANGDDARPPSRQWDYGWYFATKFGSTERIPTRSGILGELDVRGDGAFPSYIANGRWGTQTGNTKIGSLNVPIFYGLRWCKVLNNCPEGAPANEVSHQQPNLYLPPTNGLGNRYGLLTGNPCSTTSGSGCNAPLETYEEACMRVWRYSLESIIASGNTPDTISPWIGMIGYDPSGSKCVDNQIVVSDPFPVVTADLFRHKLLLLKKFEIKQAQVFGGKSGIGSGCGNDPFSNYQAWTDMKRIYQEVHDPELSSWSVITGTDVTGDPTYNPETLRRATFDQNFLRKEVTVKSVASPGPTVDTNYFTTSVRVNFTNVIAPKYNAKLLLHIESSAVPFLVTYNPDSSFSPDFPIYGRIEILGSDGWEILPVNDYASQPSTHEGFNWYGHFSPDRTLRRTFSFPNLVNIHKYINSSNQVSIRLVNRRIGGDAENVAENFVSRYDVVQLVIHDGNSSPVVITPGDVEGLSAEPMGADFNRSGDLSASDVDSFAADYVEGEPAADHNGDGVVDDADLEQFFTDFTNDI